MTDQTSPEALDAVAAAASADCIAAIDAATSNPGCVFAYARAVDSADIATDAAAAAQSAWGASVRPYACYMRAFEARTEASIARDCAWDAYFSVRAAHARALARALARSGSYAGA